MSHMVIYRTTDGKPMYQQVDDLSAAISFVERLRNADGVEGSRIYRLEQVSFRFEPYYQVRLEVSDTAEGAQPPVPPPPPVTVGAGVRSAGLDLGAPPPPEAPKPEPVLDLTSSGAGASAAAGGSEPASTGEPAPTGGSSDEGADSNGIRRGFFR